MESNFTKVSKLVKRGTVLRLRSVEADTLRCYYTEYYIVSRLDRNNWNLINFEGNRLKNECMWKPSCKRNPNMVERELLLAFLNSEADNFYYNVTEMGGSVFEAIANHGLDYLQSDYKYSKPVAEQPKPKHQRTLLNQTGLGSDCNEETLGTYFNI